MRRTLADKRDSSHTTINLKNLSNKKFTKTMANLGQKFTNFSNLDPKNLQKTGDSPKESYYCGIVKNDESYHVQGISANKEVREFDNLAKAINFDSKNTNFQGQKYGRS